MPRNLQLRLLSLALLLLMAAACEKRPRLANIPPPQPKTVPLNDQVVQVPEPPKPQTTPPTPGASPQIPTEPMNVPAPPNPPTARKRRPKLPASQPTQAAATSGPVSTSAVEDVPLPKLGRMLTPDERDRYSQMIERELHNARVQMSIVDKKPLTETQKEAAGQVRSFIRQATALRTTDLVEAQGLSHKAEVLAKDLATTVQ